MTRLHNRHRWAPRAAGGFHAWDASGGTLRLTRMPAVFAGQRRSVRAGGQGKDRGAVTAEFAVTLPAVVLLLALLLAGSAAGITQLRLEEAARAGARALARGDGSAAVEGIVRRLAGDAASASILAEGEWLRVTVAAKVSGPLGSIIPWTLSASASARVESPDSAEAPPPAEPQAVVELGSDAHGLPDVLRPTPTRLGWSLLQDAVA
jgi:TadE-like protein